MLGPGTEIGRYLIKRKLAEGGMAEIFLASAVGPEGFSKDVVIKVVRSFLATDSQFVQMFIAEARLVSRLNHANVVQIFDFGKHGESFYLAMEYVRGASLWDLRKRCREQGVPFPPTLVAEIGAQVARGLQYAHALTENGQRIGVVHRDVTPHNVLLSFDGAVKLTDFGIAKATTQQTAPGMLKGKFAYMAPEQARGEKVDARTDLFALGIVLWELLTGGRLFQGDSDLALLRAVQESLIAPPSRLNPDVPAELSDVVMKALARPPEERFQTAFEMEKALANYVLRTAQSVDDSSVGLFLQQMFREEFEAPSHLEPVGPSPAADDDFGEGKTRANKKHKTITATPVGPAPGPEAPEEIPAARAPVLTAPLGKAAPSRRGVMDDEGPSVPTEQFLPNGRPRTEQMPAFKRASRKLEPLPISEPSVVARPIAPAHEVSGEARPTVPAHDLSALETEQPSETEKAAEVPPASFEALAPVKSNTPLIAVLAMLVLGLVGAIGYVSTRPVAVTDEDPLFDAGGEERGPPNEPLVRAPPPVEPLDAGPTTIAAATLPEQPKPREEVKLKEPPPQPRKVSLGTLSVLANPFATVTIPGLPKPIEVTGGKKITAPAGTYEITFWHPRRTVKEKVTVQPGGTTPVSFTAE